MEAIQMDIDEIHERFGSKYDEGIEQAVYLRPKVSGSGLQSAARGERAMGRSFLVEPHRAVGPVRFGMLRGEVEAAMPGETPKRAKRNRMAIAEFDYFKAEGFFVYYDPDDRAIAAECFELERVLFPPDTSLNLPYREFIAWLKSQDPKVAIEADGAFRSEALGIAGGPSPGDDEAVGDVVRVESLLFYRPNYWEDCARWRRERQASK